MSYIARNMEDVIRHNTEAGRHFFDENTMRFWGSEVVSELYPNNTFITCEDNFDRWERLYTVRQYDPETAEIETVSEFQQFKRLADAQEFAERYKD